MFASLLRFELGYQMRRPAFAVCLLIMALFGFLFAVSTAIGTTFASGTMKVNAPYVIARVLGFLSLAGAVVPLIVCTDVVLRDFDSGMSELVRSSPVPTWTYLLARFTAAFLALGVIYAATAVGFEIGCRTWWVNSALVAPLRPQAYAKVLAVLVFPNLFILGALFALAAAWTRGRFAAYIALSGIMAQFVLTRTMLNSPTWQYPAAWIDPTGLGALNFLTRYWTNVEKETLLVPLQGVLLWNRLLWSGIGLGCLALALAKLARRDSPWQPIGAVSARSAPATLAAEHRPVVPYAGAGLADQVLARLRYECRTLLRSWTVAALLALAILTHIPILYTGSERDGLPLLPVTAAVTEQLILACVLPVLLIAVLFGGEMVWRERQAKIAEIIDATPVPSFVFAVTKLAALALLIAALLGLSAAIGIVYQIANAAPQIDLHLYAVQLFVQLGLPTIMLGVLAMVVHVVANNRFIGHLVTVALIASILFLEYLGVDDNLIKFSSIPEIPLSDMNGLGHFLTGPLWFLVYWGCVSVLLGVVAHLLWVRGPASPLLARVRSFRHAATRGSVGLGLLALLGTGLTGGFIYWNTRVLNLYWTRPGIEQRLVDYEKTHHALVSAVQPRVTEVEVAVDLRPETRSYSVRGQYVLANRSSQPIDTIHVQFDDGLRVEQVALDGAGPAGKQRCCNDFVFRPRVPLAPGETRGLAFALSMRNDGFRNGAHDSPIRHNGTFLHQGHLAPSIGVSSVHFLQDERRRLAYGLEALSDTPKPGDLSAYRRNYISHDADFVRFAVTVSTSPDQTAVAPGYLQREWSEGGRRYFRYEMDRPILNFWSIMSARYTVARDRWNEIELSVHYHPPHALHVPRMIEAMKLALAYCSAEFGPFQHRQMSIAEFPYGAFAQSFPNTVPYSEKAGFIVDPRALQTFDYITFMTAHEVAHQWWAHQVVSADVPGATVLSESLAEYTALMIMEKLHGQDRIRSVLKHDLDIYLRDRGTGDRERPLSRVKSTGQAHIAYQKGGIVMYALKQAVGEAAINRALARLIREHAFKSDPYPGPDDLIAALRAEAGPAHQQLITDLFEKIVLWDYSVVAASAAPTQDGKWQVLLVVEAGKLEADEHGTEQEVSLDQDVDVGLFAADPRKPDFSPQDVITMERRRLTSGSHTMELVTARKPLFAGINPFLTFIQRNFEDTVAAVVH